MPSYASKAGTGLGAIKASHELRLSKNSRSGLPPPGSKSRLEEKKMNTDLPGSPKKRILRKKNDDI